MRLTQLIYVSRPLGYDPLELENILVTSRARNAAAEITGTLISRWDLFLQMMEGPRRAVSETYARILQDRRHVEVVLVHMGDAERRIFPDWSMRDDAAPSWLWSRAEVIAGVPHATPVEEVRAVFERVAAGPPLAHAS